MKRIAMIAVALMVGVITPAASASPGSSAAKRAGVTTNWSAEYDASSYYGAVKCTGRTVVSKKYPFGKDVETCETTEGALKNVKAGSGQIAFENSEGGTVGEWESDSGSGKKTTSYSYKVNKKLTKFKLIAIYAS